MLTLLLVSFTAILVSCGGSSNPPPTPTPTGGPNGRLIPGTVQPSQTGPYGFTILREFTPEIAAQLKQVGVTWVRFQLDWAKIEPQPGQFDWSTLDNVVSLVNSNGFKLDFPLQKAPEWAKSQTCGGKPLLPGAAEMTRYATAVAQRYNGRNGHGFMNSIEIGNEEFDDHLPPIKKIIDKSCPGMNILPIAGADLKAGYQAVKSQSPQTLVGMFAIWWANTLHIQNYMQFLYQNNYGTYFDYANFHYYPCVGNQDVPGPGDPAVTVGDRPSFTLAWQTIRNVMVKYGDSGKPIWLTETGWPTGSIAHPERCVVSPQQQAQNMSVVLNAAYNSRVIQEIFWYTLNPKDKDSSILQASGPLPAYYTIQQFVRQHPGWGK
jgi:hypothetical protein